MNQHKKTSRLSHVSYSSYIALVLGALPMALLLFRDALVRDFLTQYGMSSIVVFILIFLSFVLSTMLLHIGWVKIISLFSARFTAHLICEYLSQLKDRKPNDIVFQEVLSSLNEVEEHWRERRVEH